MLGFGSVTSVLALTLGIAVIVRFFYTLIVRYWNYFTDRNVVFERGLPGLGTLVGNTLFRKIAVVESLQEIYHRHPERKFIGMYEVGGKPSYMIRDPDLIREITIKNFEYFLNKNFRMDTELDPLLGRALFGMEGKAWREMRSTMSPLFTGSKMRFMLKLMIDCVKDYNVHIRNEIKTKSNTKSKEYNMKDLMMSLANDIIGSTAFGIEINTLKNPDNEFYKMGKEIAYSVQGVKTLFLLGFPNIAKLFKLKILTDQHDNFFRNVIHNTLEERQKKNIVRNDMLHLLVMAKDGKLNEEMDKQSDQDAGFATVSEFMTSKTSEKLKNWTDEDLVAQCIIFFLAGFTGVSTTFCFLAYELSTNPDIQDRLYDEIMETDEQLNGKELTFESLQKMKYMDMVVSEVLRKWPIGTLMDRVVSKQYLLEQNDGSKVMLQPNNILWIPTFAIHRDPKLYPNPEVFDPERFSDENKKNIHPCAYLPFGSGPRNCIASRFALLQLKAVIFHILKEFKIECSPKTPIPIKLRRGTNSLEPENGFFNQLTLRN